MYLSLPSCMRGFAFACLVALSAAVAAVAQVADSASGTAPTPQTTGDVVAAKQAPVELAPEAKLQLTAERIRSLIAGTLPLEVDADTLFDVSLDDDQAIAVESARLRSLLAIEENAIPDGVPAGLWQARRKLDAARLTFYSLPKDQRTELLKAHAQRQIEDKQAAALKESLEARQRAEAAEAERQRALTAAQLARTEAERLVAEERARLLGIASQLAEHQAELSRSGTQQAEHAERTLAFHRRVRQIETGTQGGYATADALYNELRTWLRASRAELARAMQAPAAKAVAVRRSDRDPLENLPAQVDRSDVDKLLADTEATAALLARQANDFQKQWAHQLYEEVQSLNDDRLTLLPFLSPARRAAIVGFGSDGLDQALAELRQLVLVLEYHFRTTSEWLSSGAWRNWSGKSAGTATADLLQLLLCIAVFFWGRRAARALLSDWRDRLREQVRRPRSLESGRTLGLVEFMLAVLEPVGWLLLVAAIIWVLPASATELLEAQVVASLAFWIVGGWMAVVSFNTLAMRRAARIGLGRSHTGALRLRSLRLAGMTVVIIGSILSVSRMIVGEGTIYSWVWSTCWWTALPLALVIAHWWRETIFGRIGSRRRKTRFDEWLLAHREGWRGRLAAAAGGIELLARGTFAILKSWLGGFDITRRLLAYTFRRELDRIVDGQDAQPLSPVPAHVFESLSPSIGSQQIVDCSDNTKVIEVVRHIEQSGGGVYAVVGERGSGRSTVLRRVSESRAKVAFAECPFDGLQSLSQVLATATNLPPTDELDAVAAALDTRSHDVGIVIDDAHRLIRPVMGGLAEFDRLIDCARRHSTNCAWVLSFDRIVWRFLGRARTLPILFDAIVELDEWGEENIAALLRARSVQAGIAPRFDILVTKLYTEDDDYDRDESLRFAANSYYRLIWDYADGNPGVALHTWRTSLGVAEDGRVFVTPFRVPDAAVLEKLPDASVFVLRAVLQLERALPIDVAKATFVPLQEVENSLRFGVQAGFLKRVADRFAVSWNWYRPITRFLQRKHLLAGH